MKKLFGLVAISVLLSSCSIRKGEHTHLYNLDEVKNNLTVKLNEGEVIKITAETNPSTGYNWTVKLEDDCSVKLIDKSTENLYNEGIVGAPLRAIYDFKGEKIGTCTVSFDYSRSWEGPSQNPKQIKFIVK